MSNLLQHVYFIQNILSKGVTSDDTRISNRLVAHALKQARSRLIKIKLDKSDYISESNYQKLCVPLELHTYHDCSCITDNNDCQILRSIAEIPKYLVAKWGPAIQVIYLNGRRVPMASMTSNEYAEFSLTNNPKKTGYFMEENYLYVLNNKKLNTILIKGIWEDPESVDDFNTAMCTNDNSCADYYTEDFPIDAELVFPMYQLAIELLGLSYQFPEDTRNDARSTDNIQNERKN